MSRGASHREVLPDTGCEFAASCFDCPLARCKHDDPEGARLARRQMRYGTDLGVHEGGTVDEIADRLNISRRTVFRLRESERRAS